MSAAIPNRTEGDSRAPETEAATMHGIDPRALPAGVELRAMRTTDLAFLERVYGSTREAELAQTDWSDAQRSQFIAFQFRAQHQHYTTLYHGAQFLVIERHGEPVGRLYLHWRDDELRIVDIALLPEARGAGVGEALLTALMRRAAEQAKGVSIHVEQFNPAMRLYQRLGFIRTGEHGVYHLMAWRPDAA